MEMGQCHANFGTALGDVHVVVDDFYAMFSFSSCLNVSPFSLTFLCMFHIVIFVNFSLSISGVSYLMLFVPVLLSFSLLFGDRYIHLVLLLAGCFSFSLCAVYSYLLFSLSISC